MDQRSSELASRKTSGSRPDDALERAAQAVSRMDEALAALRQRSLAIQPHLTKGAQSPSPGAQHEHR